MAAFSHSLMEFLCFDPHSSNQQDINESNSNKFLPSNFFNSSNFSTLNDNHHHQEQQQQQQPKQQQHQQQQQPQQQQQQQQHHHQRQQDQQHQQQQQQQQHQHEKEQQQQHHFTYPFLSSDHQPSDGPFINESDDHQNRFQPAANPYSVTHSPENLMFIMPSFARSSSNQLSLDAPSYPEPIIPYSDDSNRFSNIDPTQPAPLTTTAAAPFDHQYFPSSTYSNQIPRPLRTFQNNSFSSQTPSSKSSNNNTNYTGSSITPPTTSSSRHASEINMDELINSSDSLTHSKSHSPDPKQLGFPQHFKLPDNPYSETGFDLIGALSRVVDRPDPKVKIGAVDTSAALVVVDARQNDLPIIFATPSFSALTGYQFEEIIGQNCRFLQKPFNPNSIKKSNKQTEDCRATLQIRSHIQAGREIQSSIVNYRKDGRPFVNLVTVIPIAWNSSEISHFVGFQTDIAALTSSLGIPPSPKTRPLILPKQSSVSSTAGSTTSQKSLKLIPAPSQVVTPQSVSPSSMSHSHDGINDLANTSCYYQAVLEESRDLILAISLKGTLFYVSPSCKEILGYEESELANQNISKFCHPSDLTGILRQLKLIGNTPHTPIDLVFRAVDRKGHIFWMEFQGQLHVEVGKGRKYLVVVGRPRSIGPLSWQAIRSAGGLGQNDFWMKLSLDGLCLFATSPVRDILSYESAEMVGQSLTQMCASEQRGLLINAIRTAHEGNDVVTLAHSLTDRNGTIVSVVSDFYPPHYSCGPRACGLPVPASKLINPPRIIFCQTNSLSSAMQRPKWRPQAQGSSSSGTRRASKGTIMDTLINPEPTNPLPVINQIPEGGSASPSPVISQASVPPDNHHSDDDLFSPLGTSKTTPWNYEFSQLKRQNVKLRSELCQRGLGHHLGTSSAGKNKEQGCTRTAKNVQTSRYAGGNPPYPSRARLYSTSTMSPEDASPDSFSELDPTYLGLGFDGMPNLNFLQTSFSSGDPNQTQLK